MSGPGSAAPGTPRPGCACCQGLGGLLESLRRRKEKRRGEREVVVQWSGQNDPFTASGFTSVTDRIFPERGLAANPEVLVASNSVLGQSCVAKHRKCEAKRLELERKLMEYIRSDAYLMKVKYMKLKKYLKEIDERQKGALLRNRTFLKEFDQFEAHMKTSSSEMIRKMAWYGTEIKSVLSLQEGNLSAEGDKEEEYNKQMLCVGRRAGISTKTAMPRGLYHPATVFMGCHTSAVSAAGGLGMWQKPSQPTESCLVPDSPSCSPSFEGLGPESRSADLECDALVEGAETHGDLATSEEGSEQLISSASDPKPEEEWLQGSIPGPKPRLGNWWTFKEANRESSVELPVPVSAEEVMLSAPSVPQGTALPGASGEQGSDASTAEGSLLQSSDPPAVQKEPSVSSAPDGHGGMLAGLSCALQLIEDVVVRTRPQHRALYQGEHVGTMGTAELLSFCNRASSLKEDDLEECEAVVLHQLRALLQSALSGCLVPENTLDAKGRAVDEKQTRPDQQRDVDMLRTSLSNHALFLKKHQVQLTEEVVEMFGSLLVSDKKLQDNQALPVLREVLPEECGDRSSIQSNESSYSLPLIPNDGGEIKQAKYTTQLTSTGEQEVTSWCEDESKEESAVEKIPITGWDSGDNSSKAKASQEMHLETSSSSNERSPPFPRTETRKGMVTAIKSKAFWGESDDSSSEIEAALRPQTHSTEADEFDDFYD
ncbi:centrosomal protein kizuna isoform X3 [Rissa tridactyla]|uniref:centrosomal protein kizuna isoform X3 n=1 Tax=Rissa tridactyla TaxID=75485 RepID=UPI0023BADDFC|nr:centrosomal protein kizuna isoform X3 [Rissa tridactyla]